MVSFKVSIASATLTTALAAFRGQGDSKAHHDHIQTLGDAAALCGNHQVISCCNNGNSAGTALDGFLGGNCSPMDLSGLAFDVPISTACANLVACCIGDQNGLLNLACTNINL